jgi:hypothetical protein
MTTITPAAAKTLPEVVGKAIYLELTPVLDSEGNCRIWQGKDSIFQIIVTPNGKDSEGNEVIGSIYNRIISPRTPRSQWDRDQAVPVIHEAELIKHFEDEGKTGSYLTSPKVEDFATLPEAIKRDLYANGLAQRLKALVARVSKTYNEETKNYDSSVYDEWAITKKFAVEVTDEDLKDIRSWKTPQAVIRRINKVRDLA